MIILLVILSAVCFYLFGAVYVEKKGHTFWSIISLIVLVLSVTVFALHDVNHLGMKVKTRTETMSLASTSNKANLLLYKQLGTGSEKIYIYKTDIHQTKAKHTWIDSQAKSKVVTTKSQPKLVIKKHQYVYDSALSKAMFGILGDNNETKSIDYRFEINPTWSVLSTNQAAKLQTALKQPATQMKLKQMVASQVKAELMQAMKKNPQMSTADQGKLQIQLTNEAKARAIEQLVK